MTASYRVTRGMRDLPAVVFIMLDHLVYAAPALEDAVREVADRLGVTPSPGGRHSGRGTRNFLLSLSSGAYLEIIGPDPEQPDPSGPRPFGVDELHGPRLVAWAVKAPDIERRVADARSAGYDPGPIQPMTRTQPDGTVLHWRLTTGGREASPDLIPFLIDWGDTPHPSVTSSQGASLREFWAESPEPESVEAKLRALGVALDVRCGEHPLLIARLTGPGGEITLS
jgi:hypothetical protein